MGETGGRNDSLPAYAWAVGYTRIITPTLTNEMQVGMVHSDKLQQSFYGNTFGIPAKYGIQGVQQIANNGGLPPITISGLTHIGVDNYTPTLQYVWSVEGVDGITKVYRNHTFKADIQIDDLQGDISQPPQGRGDFSFNGQYTDVPNKNSSLNGIGDLLLTPIPSTVGGVDYVGGVNGFSGSNIAATDDHRWYLGAYGQDDWKVTPRMTLNLGLRWDYFTPYAETRGFQANFIPVGGNGSTGTYYMSNQGCAVARSAAFNTLLTASNITLDCVPNLTLGSAQKTNFAPRVGFAYGVTQKLVTRAGFGTAYGALGNLGYGGTLGTNYPFVYTQTFPSPDSQHPLLLPNGQPATMEQAFTQYNFQNPAVSTGLGLDLYGRQYSFQTPYIQTENLTIQYLLSPHDSVQAAYVGSQGRHLDNLGYNNGNTQILPPGTLMANSNRAVDTLLGGWRINGFYTHQSGQPFTVTCPVATTADFGCFANVVSGQGLYTGGRTVTQWLNPGAFAEPPTATAIGQTDYSPLGGVRSRRADQTSATWIRRS
ncbi:MAG: TonB-dependent receptor [Terracidiphilus sp.]